MSQSITERRLVDVLMCYMRQSHKVSREVPHYEKRIDLAALHPESREIWAIEAKTKNWPDAVGQAIVNLAVAHRSYVAIYSEHAHRVSHDLLDEYGIGLIAVGSKWNDVEILKEATPSPFQNRLAADRLLGVLLEGAT